MLKYLGLTIITTFITIVVLRSINLRKQGIEAFEFGNKDKKDFIILPFALFCFYLLTANTFNLKTIPNQLLFKSEIVNWVGVVMCFCALLFFVWTMISFKKSFRVGLVENTEQGLITNEAFAISRNPIYVSFTLMLIGQFLIFSSWIFLIYIILGIVTFHKQVLKEEEFLKIQYGKEFNTYCKKTRRYL